jgi:hypothetical protein
MGSWIAAGSEGPAREAGATPWALALVSLAFALVWRVGELAQPPHHEHAWRDADGIGIARCFVREGLDLLHPRIMQRGALSGVVGMEFPLVNAAGAVLMKIGGIHDWLARLPSWLALVPLTLGAFALGRRLLADSTAAALAAGCLVVQPLVVIYARKCMPEVPMLAALVWAAAFAHDAITRASMRRAIAAGALFATAAVLKPTGFAVAVPLVIWSWRALRGAPGRARTLAACAVIAVLPLVAAALWFGYARRLGASTGTAFKLEHDWTNGPRMLLRGEGYGIFFGRIVHLYLLWPTVIWMAVRWRDSVETARRHRDLVAWAAAGIGAVVLVGEHLLAHPYYALPLLVPLALLVGAFAARAASSTRHPARARAAFALVFTATALVRVEQRASTPENDRHRRFDPERLAAAMAHVPVNGLTIATDEFADVPMSLVIIDRIGWTRPPGDLTGNAIARLQAQGAGTLVETSFGGWLAPETRATLPPPIWADDQLRAYVLASPRSARRSDE